MSTVTKSEPTLPPLQGDELALAREWFYKSRRSELFSEENEQKLRKRLRRPGEVELPDAECAKLLERLMADKAAGAKAMAAETCPPFPNKGGVCLDEVGVQEKHRVKKYLVHTAGSLEEAIAIDSLLLGRKPLPNWRETYFFCPPGGDEEYFRYCISILEQLRDKKWKPDGPDNGSGRSQYAVIFKRRDRFDVVKTIGRKLPVTDLGYKVLPDIPVGSKGKELVFIRLPGQEDVFDGYVAEYLNMIAEQEAKSDMRPAQTRYAMAR